MRLYVLGQTSIVLNIVFQVATHTSQYIGKYVWQLYWPIPYTILRLYGVFSFFSQANSKSVILVFFILL